MQGELFDFGLEGRITDIRDRLRAAFGDLSYSTTRAPIGALVKSIISGRTRDDASLRAYNRLTALYPDWRDMAAATPEAISAAIGEVTYPEPKARHLLETLNHIGRTHPDFDLAFLRDQPVARVLDWLRTLPGVGPKVAAATVNFSTLEQAAFVMDTHILRVFARLGVLPAGKSPGAAYDLVMSALQAWTAAQLCELHVLVKHLGQVKCHAGFTECRSCPLTRLCEGRTTPQNRSRPERRLSTD